MSVDYWQVCFNNIKIKQHLLYQLHRYDISSSGDKNKLPQNSNRLQLQKQTVKSENGAFTFAIPLICLF